MKKSLISEILPDLTYRKTSGNEVVKMMKIKRSEARDVLKEYMSEYMRMIGLRTDRGNASPCCSQSACRTEGDSHA